jgi:hypothetical protein
MKIGEHTVPLLEEIMTKQKKVEKISFEFSSTSLNKFSWFELLGS